MAAMDNLTPHKFQVTRAQREALNNHKGLVIWFSGLSGSGKSTIASALEQQLHLQQMHTYSLDGDNIRLGINRDLGFSTEDRTENLRRIAEIAKLFADAGIVVLASFITPTEENRNQINSIIPAEDIVHIFVNCPLEVCEKRDVKGLYAKARKGEIKNFTGIDAPFEAHQKPDITLHSHLFSVQQCVQQTLDYLHSTHKIRKS
ncbi:MAG: adenylyl-sulfate kinase [Weeksellaceae bacterium]|nr:adenylyl-sulfate kinase [Weeksellaceae bacterium]